MVKLKACFTPGVAEIPFATHGKSGQRFSFPEIIHSLLTLLLFSIRSRKNSHYFTIYAWCYKRVRMPARPDALELSEKCFLTQTWAAVQGGFIFRSLNCCSFSALVSVFVESVTKQALAEEVQLHKLQL